MPNLNYLRYRLTRPLKSWKNKYLKHITQKQARQDNLYLKAVEEISQYCHEPAETVERKYKLGPEQEKGFHIFNEQNNLNKASVDDFYRNCSYYVYELPLWNAEKYRPGYLRLVTLPYLRRRHYARVMDFGAGSGDFCIELAKNNLEVTYCDIGEQLSDFARWRFQKRNLNVKMAKGIDGLRGEVYDCIFSFDAFEHIKDFAQTLQALAGHIAPGGSLVFSGAFSGKTLHLEENERYDNFKNLDRLMRDNGLTFKDKFAQFYFYKRANGCYNK
ncbi:MAG: class I SAM-dependent methyltransferase [Candidatus Omnitrophica bacterium]|nr:class I SAM-dependent methyltransferase [Candidatus Omnitrophota bacterium]